MSPELEELITEIGIARDDMDSLVSICEACAIAGMSDQEIATKIHEWLAAELNCRRNGKQETLH